MHPFTSAKRNPASRRTAGTVIASRIASQAATSKDTKKRSLRKGPLRAVSHLRRRARAGMDPASLFSTQLEIFSAAAAARESLPSFRRDAAGLHVRACGVAARALAPAIHIPWRRPEFRMAPPDAAPTRLSERVAPGGPRHAPEPASLEACLYLCAGILLLCLVWFGV
ncbi:MAG: hypothetical protein L0Z55_00705 [Planctomycetes bacterium]|nr:hypothetical protein [Planctomycetota bacterium]